MRYHQPGEAECVRSLHCMSGGGCRLFSCQGRGRRSVCPSHTPSLRTEKEGISAMRLFSISTRSIKHPSFNRSLFLYYQICLFVLTGGHFVVRSWDPVTWHCRSQRGVLPLALALAGGPVTGWRSPGRGASMRPGWISKGWRWRTHRRFQRWWLLKYWWLCVAAVGGLLQWGMSGWWKKKGQIFIFALMSNNTASVAR